MTRVTLAIDAMGGDFGPSVTVPAALQALNSSPNLVILLVGLPDVVKPLLAKIDSDLSERLHFIPCESIIASDVRPSQAVRQRSGSSMQIVLELVREGRADACLSAGNTGVLMTLALLTLRALPGIRRPALATLLPNQCRSQTVVLDLGANLTADASMLVDFALMGQIVAQQVLGIAAPRVALLNIGQEASKGLESIRQADRTLRALSKINYIGYLEANALLTGQCDVLVTDGFSGNITLKTMEGVLKLFIDLLGTGNQSDISRPWWRKLITKLIKQKISRKFGEINPDRYNGASLLGVPGVVIKSHGGADQQAFYAAIEQTVLTVEQQVPERIAQQLNTVLARSDNAYDV